MDDDNARDHQASAAKIDRVLLPGLEEHAAAARELTRHPNWETDISMSDKFAINAALTDPDNYKHAVTATDDICERLERSLSRHHHLEHLARIRNVEISKIDSYDQWLADARKLSSEAEDIVRELDVYDCGFTPLKWQEFSAHIRELDTAIGHESRFFRDGQLYLQPIPHSTSASEQALQAHASYRELRQNWHEYINRRGQYDQHPYENAPSTIINAMQHLSTTPLLPDDVKQAISSLHDDFTNYRNASSDVETCLQDTDRSLDTNRDIAQVIEQLGAHKARAEDIEGYAEWQDETAKLVRTGEQIIADDSSTHALYLKHNPELKDRLKSRIDMLKNTLKDALPSRTQELAQQQQIDQHRSISRGRRM